MYKCGKSPDLLYDNIFAAVFGIRDHFLGCLSAVPGVKAVTASTAKPWYLLDLLKSNSQKLQNVISQIVH